MAQQADDYKTKSTQTAVEWLEEKLLTEGLDDEFVKQAKQMEKEQIMKAHTNGQAEFDTEAFRQKVVDSAEQYYNKTYGKE